VSPRGGRHSDGAVRGARRFRLRVGADDEALRIDQLLARRVAGLSRGDARRLLELGGVFVDRRRVKIASRRLRAGQEVEVSVGGAFERSRAVAQQPSPEPRIVYHDEHVAVVEKPAGVVTAPTREGDRGSLVDLIERELLPGARVFLVHRLDRMTSGLLVVACSELASRVLSERLRTHDVEREYLAVVRGRLAGTGQVLDAPIGGRRAVTHVLTTEALADEATLVRARLETGRTHQIRIHLAGIGHPVLGDRQYGAGKRRRLESTGRATSEADSGSRLRVQSPGPTVLEPPRLALHAARLGFAHPTSGERLHFESSWPDDLRPWLEGMRMPRT
jgi:23S rRNA pseudouridine1911/1915/1917 synthase